MNNISKENLADISGKISKRNQDQRVKYTDPLCGMSTKNEQEFHGYKHNEEHYYFCSNFHHTPGDHTHNRSGGNEPLFCL